VLAVVDREEGGAEAIRAAGLTSIALARASEIVARMA
jgi:orotate phosphoribosyltransferase